METNEINVEILRSPTDSDWERCKMLAFNTIGKEFSGEVTDAWKEKMLKCQHSPIRTLMFTIKMEIPYYVSTHFVRHKFGVEHYVTSQRNDRQDKYDRNAAPQNAKVIHIMDINAEELMFMANRRLCKKADITTRYVMAQICMEVENQNPEFKGVFKPTCEKFHECPEFKACGYYDNLVHKSDHNNIQVHF